MHRDCQRRCLKVERGTPAGRRMLCGWRHGAELTGHTCGPTPQYARNGRQFRQGGPTRGSLKVKPGRSPGRRIPCGWRDGEHTSLRVAFHRAKRPTASDDEDRRWRNAKAKRGPPTGAANAVRAALWLPKSQQAGYARISPKPADEMRLGLRLRAYRRQIRAHFTICHNRPAGSDPDSVRVGGRRRPSYPPSQNE